MFTVYILFSEKHSKIYIGVTSNLPERYKSHQYLAKKGYTSRFRPWKVIFTRHFENKKEAFAFERSLKGAAGRKFIWLTIVPELQSVGFGSSPPQADPLQNFFACVYRLYPLFREA